MSRSHEREAPRLIVEPEDGVEPILDAIRGAKRTVDLTVFRFDRAEVETALVAAAARGVHVRALVAHANNEGEELLRQVELRFLQKGITVARTADVLARYHDKLLILDGGTLFVRGFNFTYKDMEQSRSLALVTREHAVVREAARLFQADVTRQPFEPREDALVVSPLNARRVLARFLAGARKQLLLYDPQLTDRAMLRLLAERAAAGVEVRVIGESPGRSPPFEVRALDTVLHVRAIVRDGRAAFVGSQSLRKLELNSRREVGLIVRDHAVAEKLRALFESDWKRSVVRPAPVPEITTTARDVVSLDGATVTTAIQAAVEAGREAASEVITGKKRKNGGGDRVEKAVAVAVEAAAVTAAAAVAGVAPEAIPRVAAPPRKEERVDAQDPGRAA